MGVGNKENNIYLFSNYLTDSTQSARTANNFSHQILVLNGASQGSFLAAVLFVIYINRFCTGQFRGKLTDFTDDMYTCVYLEGVNFPGFHCVPWWFATRFIVLSDKTKCVFV